jgi:hypothetical protein
VLVALAVASGRRGAVDREAQRLAAVERKLDLVMTHLGIREAEPDVPGAVEVPPRDRTPEFHATRAMGGR